MLPGRCTLQAPHASEKMGQEVQKADTHGRGLRRDCGGAQEG
jgi:hypothetical protein